MWYFIMCLFMEDLNVFVIIIFGMMYFWNVIYLLIKMSKKNIIWEVRKLIIIVFYFISEFNGYKLFCLYGYIIYLYIDIIKVRKKIIC